MSDTLTRTEPTPPPDAEADHARSTPGSNKTILTAVVLFVLLSFVRTITDADALTSSITVGVAIRARRSRSCWPVSPGLWAERVGIVNIGIEGMMILGTWFGGWAAWQWGPWVGLLLAIARRHARRPDPLHVRSSGSTSTTSSRASPSTSWRSVRCGT